jgi:hypothetical protein
VGSRNQSDKPQAPRPSLVNPGRGVNETSSRDPVATTTVTTCSCWQAQMRWQVVGVFAAHHASA